MNKRYINLEEAEKALIKRVDWNIENATSRDIEIRNECLEVLALIDDYIEIPENSCKVCSNEYNQYVDAILVKDYENLHKIEVNYCPVCGRKLS